MTPAGEQGAAAPGSAASFCPGCRKPVDALRAGHVAIYDGVFLYYCDQTCKAVHLRAIASHLGDDVPTLDPPAVAERMLALAAANGAVPSTKSGSATSGNGGHGANGRSGTHASYSSQASLAIEDERSGVATSPTVPGESAGERTTQDGATESPLVLFAPPFHFPDSAPLSPAPAPASAPPPSQDLTIEVPVGPASLSAPPRTLRSPLPPAPSERVYALSEPPAPPAAVTTRDRAVSATSVIGGIAGVLVALLVIADVGLAPRLALACVAVVALVARLVLAPRDLADASPLLVAGPVVTALVAALASFGAGDSHAPAIVVLAGLSASISIAVEEAIARARADVSLARSSINAALAGPSRVLRGDGPSEMLLDVKSGETVLVEPGDVVGVDGVVSKGEAIVLPWHGATVEVTKAEGDAISAGARVVSGRVRVVTAWAGNERAWVRSTSSAIARADVSAPIAQFSRALVERAAPAAALVAALAAIASGGAGGWLEAIAAACAVSVGLGGRGLVASVALVHARAQMGALAHGIVYKDAKAFDTAGRAATAVACSRGTVLTGEPEIVSLEPVSASGASESRILALAAGAETASTHPLANAILRAARTRGVTPESVRSATVHSGLGVTALASSGDRLVVGSRALLLQEQVSVAVAESRASELEAQGRSVLLVALAGKLVGLVALQDGLRAGARAAVQRLLDARIEPVLLSGESRETCETIARALEIDHVRPEVLPADRGAEVRALAEGGHVVAVIGHPASDDGALGAADVAIAMGAPSPASAGEWGVWLASDDVRDAALALSLTHAARDRARAVLAAGVVPGVLALLALAFGLGPLACGPLAMVVGAAFCLGMARRD